MRFATFSECLVEVLRPFQQMGSCRSNAAKGEHLGSVPKLSVKKTPLNVVSADLMLGQSDCKYCYCV